MKFAQLPSRRILVRAVPVRKARSTICLVAGILVCLGLAGPLSAQTPQEGPGPYNLTIFHTNDSHSYVFPRPAAWRDDGKSVGGVLPLYMHLTRERQSAAADLLLDAGDFMTGNPICEIVEDGVTGMPVARIMNALGYTAGTVGNHEFDIGRAQLEQLVRQFDFPLIAADILDEKGHPLFRSEPLVVKKGGLKIGIMGISCAGMGEVVSPNRFAGLTMGNQVEIARSQARQLDPSTDLLVLITHNGVGEDRELARQLKGSGIDVIVGGHSHSRLKRPLVEEGILVIQAGSKFTNLGRLDLMVEDDRIVSYQGRLIDLWAEGAAEATARSNPSLAKMVNGYQDQVDRVYGRQIGLLTSDWRKGRGEHNLGNFLADSIRQTADADVAFINSGGIRKGMNAGPVTALDIHEILPFSNTIVTVELDARQLAQIVQQNADAQVGGGHGILQISGISYAFRAGPDQKTAVVEEILVSGQKLDANRRYLAAMPDYVAMMQGVYLKLELPETRDLEITLSQAVVKVVEASGPIDSRIEGRIRKLD